MKAALAGLVFATLIGAGAPAAEAEIDVMTQNQYLGAQLTPELDAPTAVPFDPAAFGAAVVDAVSKLAATRPWRTMAG